MFKTFELKSDLRKRYALSPTLFDLVLEKVMRDVRIRCSKNGNMWETGNIGIREWYCENEKDQIFQILFSLLWYKNVKIG